MKMWILIALSSALCGTGVPLLAQTTPNRLSVDLNAGLGYGWSGTEQTDRTGFATGIRAAWRITAAAHASPIVGIDASWQWQPGGDAVCLIGRGGSCIPSYPTFKALSALVGVEWPTGQSGAVRVVAGSSAVAE
jgi:hypothetical protein